MPHVSKKRLPEETLQQIIDSFLFVLTDIKDKKSMAGFVDSFFSKTEKMMFSKRLAIIYLLNEGIEETKISQILGVTQSTVSLMKLRLANQVVDYEEALGKIKKQKLLKELKILALRFAKYATKAAGGRI